MKKNKNLVIISGARPQFIKISPVLHYLDTGEIPYHHIHSGQHYDYEMSEVFFKELGIKSPDVNLGVGSHSHAIQTAKIMEKLDPLLRKNSTKAVFIPGDTNTTIAGALTACKKNIPVIHHEAGLRSFDRKMPEEINRIVADHCSEILLAPTPTAKKILLNEGINRDKIYVTGDTMLDVFMKKLPLIEEKKNEISTKFDVPNYFAVLTIHRQENTDDLNKLKRIFLGLQKLSKIIPIIFPIHPRTMKIIKENNLDEILQKGDIKILDPLGYIEFMGLVHSSKLVITDSGGLQKESAFAGKPCMTIRDTTEWIETIENNWNILVDSNYQNMGKIYRNFVKDCKINKKDVWKYYGAGKASKRIHDILMTFLGSE